MATNPEDLTPYERSKAQGLVIQKIAQLMDALDIGAVWFSATSDNKKETHAFIFDNPELAKIVGAAFSEAYEKARAQHFPEGEKFDSNTQQVTKG